jgi:hypothetical protein
MSTEKDRRSTPKNQCRDRSAPSKIPPGKTDKPHSAPLTRVLLSWLSRRRFLKHIGDVAKMVIAAIIAGRLADDNKPRPRVRTSKAEQSSVSRISAASPVEQREILASDSMTLSDDFRASIG